jgi:hypothetical protein
MLNADKCGFAIADASVSACSIAVIFNARSVVYGSRMGEFTGTPNVELTGAARVYRAASSDRRERG